ncbi:MAG: oxygen-independent coproporphyrinogen III oxidase [Bacteroidetes bacterium GWF2_42_66]|nr:MAG: oxygen-independent coproporphyrinogen III oxidase [Bacteroidetes bacterium GWA2_42_15]OFX97923.1 MAG: oxygen-independent coproporphyrinogen III oxidase [Bacteroidetes bacterium GWE2_42_39]OFY45839.1 MAG: oxygen-independent coproporphyrinogen III oxidase [Bacteroidetes bacterium GWF2_42_66]HBL74659.1 oxygen-independent coproporphyrinogen III oxidase [Prolixibacteraceae bacterium]HCU60834.1 oxygen-independent coproporphyrinogen III oxidase [Prolixibacteraceae bacterium]
MIFPEHLIEKYNVPVPRYTSYPPANFFSDTFTSEQYADLIRRSNNDQPENISIYIHIPFCSKICHYCGCNTHLTRNRDLMRIYVDALKKEIGMVAALLNPQRKVSQVHWGGGTPNYLPIEWIEEIMQLIARNFTYTEKPEIAMECHPAHLDFYYSERLIKAGFNRISLGIQDFDKKVLDTVNRDDSVIPVSELVAFFRRFGHVGVNFDFIYGLPHQNPESFYRTIQKAVELSPDRLVTFSYAHVPWVRRAQKVLEVEGLASPQEKLKMFEAGYNLLKENGFHSIGFDHFAKAGDELTIALANKKLHRNFQGYCTRETTGQVYAFGATGISQLENSYAQNAKDVNSYVELINQGIFTVEKGYELNGSEKIIRHVINEIMCNQYLDFEEVAVKYSISEEELKQTLDFSEEKLDEFIAEGLVQFGQNKLIVNEAGKLFSRNIASAFDPKLANSGKAFSKSV